MGLLTTHAHNICHAVISNSCCYALFNLSSHIITSAKNSSIIDTWLGPKIAILYPEVSACKKCPQGNVWLSFNRKANNQEEILKTLRTKRVGFTKKFYEIRFLLTLWVASRRHRAGYEWRVPRKLGRMTWADVVDQLVTQIIIIF
jgi:hypothetical protein